MNKFRALLLLYFIFMPSTGIARQYSYDEVCFLNSRPAKCIVNKGMMIPLSQGSDIDILWADGRKTTIRMLGNWSEGGRVLLDGHMMGTIKDSILSNGIIHKVITTDEGSTLIFAFGD